MLPPDLKRRHLQLLVDKVKIGLVCTLLVEVRSTEEALPDRSEVEYSTFPRKIYLYFLLGFSLMEIDDKTKGLKHYHAFLTGQAHHFSRPLLGLVLYLDGTLKKQV